MPLLAEFYGVRIYMYHREHGPPHFHVLYAEFSAMIGIDPVVLVGGRLPARALSMVFEWAALHQNELRNNWERSQMLEPLERIEPLE